MMNYNLKKEYSSENVYCISNAVMEEVDKVVFQLAAGVSAFRVDLQTVPVRRLSVFSSDRRQTQTNRCGQFYNVGIHNDQIYSESDNLHCAHTGSESRSAPSACLVATPLVNPHIAAQSLF